MIKKKRVVLVGAGHAHLHLIHHSTRFHSAGLSVTLIEPGKFWYSGMATGMLGGLYRAEQDQITVSALAQKKEIRHITDSLTALSISPRFITTANGMEVPYDVLSFNIGRRPVLHCRSF